HKHRGRLHASRRASESSVRSHRRTDPITGSELSVGDRLISLVGLIPGGAVAKLAKAGASARELARFKKAVAEIDRLRTAAGEIKKFADEARKFETASGEFGKVARKGERSVKKV